MAKKRGMMRGSSGGGSAVGSARPMWNSPASRGASMGPGPMGAGQLEVGGNGPGPAARKKMGRPSDMSPQMAASRDTPRGLVTYKEGSGPIRHGR